MLQFPYFCSTDFQIYFPLKLIQIETTFPWFSNSVFCFVVIFSAMKFMETNKIDITYIYQIMYTCFYSHCTTSFVELILFYFGFLIVLLHCTNHGVLKWKNKQNVWMHTVYETFCALLFFHLITLWLNYLRVYLRRMLIECLMLGIKLTLCFFSYYYYYYFPFLLLSTIFFHTLNIFLFVENLILEFDLIDDDFVTNYF